MKNVLNVIALAALAAAVSACSTENEGERLPRSEGNVEFITRLPSTVNTRGPVYTSEEFRILAFRKADGGNDYTYLYDIPVGKMQYDGSALKGGIQLPEGDYKFLPCYGLVTPGSYSWPTLTDAVLNDDLYVTHTEESFPATFMLNSQLDAVPSYTVTLDGEKQSVNSLLRRAVSRIDVLFIRADKDATTGAFTEKTGSDVFGPEGLASVKIDYTDANNFLGLSGEKVAGVFDVTHNISPAMSSVTMGTGSATTVETAGYDYDNVLPADVISGSAYLKGTCLIPNTDNAGTTGMVMKLTSGKGSVRTITIGDKIPVERNKATLVKIYVLGDNVFTTELDLGVDIDTVWDGYNYTEEEIN